MDEIYDGLRKEINHRMPAYMNIFAYRIHEAEFEKTPKKTIKRFVYM